MGHCQLGAIPREPGPARAEGGVASLSELGLESVEAAEVLVDLPPHPIKTRDSHEKDNKTKTLQDSYTIPTNRESLSK